MKSQKNNPKERVMLFFQLSLAGMDCVGLESVLMFLNDHRDKFTLRSVQWDNLAGHSKAFVILETEYKEYVFGLSETLSCVSDVEEYMPETQQRYTVVFKSGEENFSSVLVWYSRLSALKGGNLKIVAHYPLIVSVGLTSLVMSELESSVCVEVVEVSKKVRPLF